ncbi:ATP-binding cassette domain-containing protein [Pseudonocardia sp. C8]|uniref:ABC transporter ATP-binding protein n=1 Tax=Pseudonocardia sp. C8 TaxID=2762759 RepID=UPI0016430C2C|nr:oligopeptide/dipeptide ABC transporter ATP-binding protein [Pseudonocardia sp. C8]MBC3190432.1 ATP-binding cassette domain-containing protein [Pseudonocardia sp. C8]
MTTVEARDPAVLLEVRDLTQRFAVKGRGGGAVRAVDGVSFHVRAGETLGLVGESGCGKSTTARAILQTPRPSSGEVIFDGVRLGDRSGPELRRIRAQMQMVFQDPFAALNPGWTVRDIVAEPLVVQRVGTAGERAARVDELLDLVGLDPARYADRGPRQLSGGQAQRVGIARALALDPKLVICDESVSSLDVSIQAQILNLFDRLGRELGLTYLFIAHDLAVVKHVSDRVGVMYLGRIVELGPCDRIYDAPAHPYTAALLDAVPRVNGGGRRAAAALRGEIPSPLNPPSGCRFRTRCPIATDRCAAEPPELAELGDGRLVACHFPLVDEDPQTGKGSTR